MNKVIVSLINGETIGFTSAGMQHVGEGINRVGQDIVDSFIEWIEQSNTDDVYVVECNKNKKITLYRKTIVYVIQEKVGR